MITGLAKLQTGLRVDRILFKKFQELCGRERLRVGEAVEALMRASLANGGVASLAVDASRSNRNTKRLDEILFRSKLARLQAALRSDRSHLEKTGEVPAVSDVKDLVEELFELAPKIGEEKLLDQFETLLGEADKLYADQLFSQND